MIIGGDRSRIRRKRGNSIPLDGCEIVPGETLSPVEKIETGI